ncbi:hypothetical protein FIV42_11125 [Persicimonas caeni]|uniref:Uncharacterized protein n=1 Tax=Persicimonas caeni TaxID=2292766 RepID=A0A4Y6PSG5_PERCE|nr:hypothetical protein [Persicimonas caeni]QDG51272.1 hypothetical protein FIV42_11125 [Persicimonas caeni]QED32493.1 hypothetical protein FRD00_11120 [Persicimonas caeni]
MTRIEEICTQGGLRVAEIRQAGDVLVVVPASLEALPSADALEKLAEQLREASSCRYVTVAIDEAKAIQDA